MRLRILIWPFLRVPQGQQPRERRSYDRVAALAVLAFLACVVLWL